MALDEEKNGECCCGHDDHEHEHLEHEHDECNCEHDEHSKHKHESHEHHEHKKEHDHHHHDDDDDDCGCGCGCGHGHSHGHGEDDEEEEHSLKKLIIAALLFVLAILFEKTRLCEYVPGYRNGQFGIGLLNHGDMACRGIYLALFFASYILVGLGVLREAVENLLHGKVFGEEFLMALATVGALVMGEYSEAVAVMLLFQLGEFLEDLAVDKSKRSITDLMDIRPDKAFVIRDGDVVGVMAQDVKIGDIIVVKPGERVPLDGKICKGTSLVDTSALTGESVPREVVVGDEVLGGVVNTSGILEIEVTKEFGESTVSRVLEMVENAQNKKAKAAKFITRFAKIYTPIVCIIAVMVAIIPSVIIIGYGAGYEAYGSVSAVWHTWVYRALELLVVSCPCALVISVPLSFFAGLGLASKKGILIKGSNYIEALSKTNTVAFDKTGTLTKGVFVVTGVHVADEKKVSSEELVAYATHAEYYSNHPISRSLKNAHSCDKCESLKGDQMEEISGHGVKCTVEGKVILAGNMRLMEREGVQGFVPCSESDAGTIVHVAVDGWYAGHIVISDVEKDDAVDAIKKLHAAGVKKAVMLTGDGESAALAAANKIGMDEVFHSLLPQDKVSKIEVLLKENEGTKNTVAFVGDGINDAPVLSRSDVGIAMGGMGSDAAIEAADVVIMDDMPTKVSEAVKVSKKTMLNVKENVIFALGVKTLIMVLCACGIANMWIAVFGDVGVTMIAVLNAMRLLAGVKKNQ